MYRVKKPKGVPDTNLSVSGRVKLAKDTSDSLPSAFASKNTGDRPSSEPRESVYMEAVEVGSDTVQQMESRRLVGVMGLIRV